MVLGLRGFPDVQGGVETHAENLYPLLAALGCRVEVIVRSRYVDTSTSRTWRGVRFRRLWSPPGKGLEAFGHSFLGVLYAAVKRPDILHIHAIGPALMVPIARLLRLRVVVTHHGPDYDREKWGLIGKCVLRLGERWGMRYASERIVISEVIRALVRNKHHRDSIVIPNGVALRRPPNSKGALQKFLLVSECYILWVGRFVPEKRHLDLVEAFAQANLPGWKLVLVGAIDHQDHYCNKVQSAIEKTPGVLLAGFQSGKALQELYANAGIFVLPSSHEGLPIALLEALSYGIPVLASDIAPHLEIGLPEEHYFPMGDVPALASALRRFATRKFDPASQFKLRTLIKERYDWKKIAHQTLAVYRVVMGVQNDHGLVTSLTSSFEP